MGVMATGRSDVEIEFLAPDERAFGEGNVADFVGFDTGIEDPFDDDAPASRWLGVAVAVTVTGLIAAGVVAAQPWNDDTAGPPQPPSPAATTTTAMASTATVLPIDPEPAPNTSATPAVYVLDPVPASLVLTESGPGFDTNQPTGWGEVWAEPGATRTTGRWFSITLLPFETTDGSRDPLTEVDVNGTPGLLGTAGDGVATIRFDRGQPDSDRLVVVSGFGVDVVALARSLEIIDDRPQLVDDRPVVRDPTLTDGLDRIAGAPATQQLVDSVLFPQPLTTFSVYRSAETSGEIRRGTVVIQHSPIEPSNGALEALASVRIGQLPGTWRVPSTFRGDDLVLATRHYAGTVLRVARWRTGDAQITVLTDRPFSELLELLPAVQPRS